MPSENAVKPKAELKFAQYDCSDLKLYAVYEHVHVQYMYTV